MRVLLWIAWLSALVPAIASAQDAEALIQQGLDARREGRDAEAVELFRRAHAIDGSARSLAQLALAEQAHGDWADAERDLVRALATADAWVTERRAVLEQALVVIRSHLGRLDVECNIDGAMIAVDGRPAGTLPLPEPLSVEAGSVVVTVRAQGYVEVQRTASVRAGELSRLSVALVAEPAAPVPQQAVIEQAVVEQAVVEQAMVPSRGPSPFLITGLAGAGATALTLAATIIASVVREDAVSVWNDDARCPPTSPGGRMDSCASQWSTLRTAEDWAIGLGIATGVLAAASVSWIAIGLGDAGAAIDASPHSLRLRIHAAF
ncbi:MAG: PEGA domain-containing protein [Sandaracinaceae bacterium]|nr:PEGA domain-containing protein [Sandaracinaceae bacterium]